MDPLAMKPHGAALLAYFEGDRGAALVVRRDDGLESRIPVSHFFRKPPDFTRIERTALDLCVSPVLDAGAGTGLHSLTLRERGLEVTAIDICPEAVAVMIRRGLSDARRADVFDFEGGPFATVMLMGHGIGMVETLAGLGRFLTRVGPLLSRDGQVLLDSMDVRATNDPGHLAYHEARRRAGRYFGEIGLQFGFAESMGPPCGWLQVDAGTLEEHAARAGYACQVLAVEESGDYLARLTRAHAT